LNEYRQFVHRIGLIGIAQFLIGLSGIILLPILTKSLSIEDYGIWVLLTVTIGLIPPLVMLGLPYTMVRFLAAIKNRDEIQEGFYSIAIVVAIIAAFTALTLFFLADQIGAMLFYNQILLTQILCSIIFMECINGFLLNYFRTFQQIQWYSSLMILRTTLQLVLIGIFILLGYGIFGAVISLVITNIILLGIMARKIFLEIGFIIPKFMHLREYFTFCLPTVPGNLSTWILDSSDRFVIGIFLGAAFVGYYSPAYALGSMISMFSAPLVIMLPPVLSKYHDENDGESVTFFLNYSIKYYLALAIPAMIGLSLLAKPLLTLLTTPEIALNGYLITPFIAVSGLLFGLYLILGQIFALVKKTAMIGMIWIFAAFFNLGLNIFFVPWIGLLGAAITTLIAYFLVFILTFYYSFKYLKFDLNVPFILKSIVSSVLMGIVIIFFSQNFSQTLITIIFLIIISGVVYGISLFILGGFKKEEIIFFKNVFNNFQKTVK
jgi:O-antigen/teichoic acid export membrane protein